jgi:hypothetical protein
MPAHPTYCHRIPAAVAALRQSEGEWVDRRRLEELLGVSKTVAWRLLRHCGAEPGPGNTLICRRPALIARLEELLAEGGRIDLEIRRHDRLAAFLEKIRPEVLANLTHVARDAEALALLSSRFQSLPAHVALTPSSLHIDFDSTDQFLAAVGALVYALHNDFEKIRDFLEQDANARHPEMPV